MIDEHRCAVPGLVAVAASRPVRSIAIRDVETCADPGRCLDQGEVGRRHFLEGDNGGDRGGDGEDEGVEVGEGGGHALGGEGGLAVDVECDEFEGGGRGDVGAGGAGGRVEGFPFVVGVAVKGLGFG